MWPERRSVFDALKRHFGGGPERRRGVLWVSPSAIWSWGAGAQGLDAASATRWETVDAALAAWVGSRLSIALSSRVLHTEVEPGPASADPVAALAQARARLIERHGREAEAWPLAQWLGAAAGARAPRRGSAARPEAPQRSVWVAWHSAVGSDPTPARQLRHWQALAQQHGIELDLIEPGWALWMRLLPTSADDGSCADPAGSAAPDRPRHWLWLERDAAQLHLTRMEFDVAGLVAVRQRRLGIRPGDEVASALAREPMLAQRPMSPPGHADDEARDGGVAIVRWGGTSLGAEVSASAEAAPRFDAAPPVLAPACAATSPIASGAGRGFRSVQEVAA